MLRSARPLASGRIPLRGADRRPFEIVESGYTVRLAASPEELDAALALRFDVFNLELGEGLASSYLTGRDADEYDAVCDHLVVAETETGRVVGTYRLMTPETALAARGFYSTGEFQLGAIPIDVLANSVELGRACVARDHRNTRVLFLLWKGIAAFMEQTEKRYLFGCCSLTSQDPVEGLSLARRLEADGHVHDEILVPARPGFECAVDDVEPATVRMPQLFGIYLRFGAKVCSPPAIDRAFGTIDFLVLFDTQDLEERDRRTFFGATQTGA